jgi:hypothetical protein
MRPFLLHTKVPRFWYPAIPVIGKFLPYSESSNEVISFLMREFIHWNLGSPFANNPAAQ